jgi:hypothetical protein
MPSPPALSFEELVGLHGDPVNVIHQTILSYNDYGHPVKAEISFTEQGFIRSRPVEAAHPIGHIKNPGVSVLLKQWAPVEEDLCELEIEEQRYHIIGVVKNEAYLEVTARREVP